MSSKERKRKLSGKGDKQQQQRSPFLHAAMTDYDYTTLKSVLYGYLGFLRNMNEPKAGETLARLQGLYGRLPEHLETSDVMYFSYEERMAILEAVIGFKLLLVTIFPQTAQRDVALADVERLYQCLTNTRSLSLN